VLAALGALGIAAAVVALLAGRSSVGQGPLVDQLGGGKEGIAQPAPVGRVISASDLVVQDTSDHAVVLDRVDFFGLPAGTYRGGYVVPFPLPRQVRGILTTYWRYHVPRYGRVLPGVTIAPHTKAYVVLALTARSGQHQWTHEDLVYHDIDGTAYRRHIALSGAVCAPLKKYVGRCNAPDF